MVYFAPAHPARPDRQPFSAADWQRKGVSLVYRFADLRSAVGDETEVIVIDAEVRSQVDSTWLRAQLRQHRVIVGINIDLRNLQELLGDTQPWTTQWQPPDAMFSMKVWGTMCSSGTQDRFSWWSPLDKFLDAMVLPAVNCSRK